MDYLKIQKENKIRRMLLNFVVSKNFALKGVQLYSHLQAAKACVHQNARNNLRSIHNNSLAKNNPLHVPVLHQEVLGKSIKILMTLTM